MYDELTSSIVQEPISNSRFKDIVRDRIPDNITKISIKRHLEDRLDAFSKQWVAATGTIIPSATTCSGWATAWTEWRSITGVPECTITIHIVDPELWFWIWVWGTSEDMADVGQFILPLSDEIEAGIICEGAALGGVVLEWDPEEGGWDGLIEDIAVWVWRWCGGSQGHENGCEEES